MTAEAGLRSRVLHAVRQQWPRSAGVLLRGNPASAATGPGHPDIDGVVRSRPIALELKKARGKPTPLQALRLQDLRDAGCYAWIVRSPYEACEAVYWVAKGWTRPLSNEPLDLNAWLTGDPPKVEAAPFEPKAQEAPTNAEVAFLMDNDTGDTFEALKADALAQLDTPEHHHAVEVVTGTGKRPTVDEELGFGDPREPALPHQGDDPLVRLDADLRTVGDRVTILWERQGEFLAVLQSIDARLSKLLEMVAEDPDLDTNGVDIDTPPPPVLSEPISIPTPRKRRKSGKVPLQVEPQPEPTSDIAF